MGQDGCRPKGLFPWETEEQVGAMVKLVHHAMRRSIEQVIRPLGLTHQQGQCLRVLTMREGSTHSELEHVLGIEKPSVTSLVNGMEKRGWVVRRQHPEDARIKRIYLTEQGEELAGRVICQVDQTKRRLQESLEAAEAAQLVQLLKKLLAAYDGDMKQGSPKT
ncbi:MarR family winged helix-turn-helix transcriptional regulator [Gorillibacterium sp. sgz5001074]|uniref:MarR family winged helix-turn-helix transcriptional regulator n=1 Tax=Gorillibacterium sp. sgz5001074 TaxID=3446695 RepID=UPI003F66A3DC